MGRFNVILFVPHKLNKKGKNRAKCEWHFVPLLRGIFSLYTFNLCGNKSGVQVQVCFRFGNTLFYFRRINCAIKLLPHF